MKNKFWGKIMSIIAVVILFAFLLTFDAIAAPVAKVFKAPVQAVVNTAKTILFAGIGVFLIYSGVMALAVPVVGVALIAVGAGLLFLAIKPLFGGNKSGPEL